MPPRFRSLLSSFPEIRSLNNLRGLHHLDRLQRRLTIAGRRPSRLTLAVAAATVVIAVFAMIIAGVTSGTSPRAASSDADAIGHVTAAGQPATHPVPATRPGQQASLHPASAPSQAPPAQAAATHPAAPPAPPAPPPQPYQIYDSVSPSAIPAGHEMAVYARGHFAASASQVAGRGPVLWIDTTGTDYSASALDVEPGNVTPSQAATWAYNRLQQNPTAIAHLYTFRNEWPAVQAAVAALPSWMQSHIHWWIADPTGVPHMVPGSEATQWYWGANYDISTAMPGF